jgi:SAM-dependent methyltransferase
VKVLQTAKQIEDARFELRNMGVSSLRPDSRVGRFLVEVGLYPGVHIGDFRKSWDVLETVRFLAEHVSKDTPVLDLGAFGSEMPPALCKLGFEQVHGIDLNSKIATMPYRDRVQYVQGDFLRTPYPDASFGAITAISVIEHGYDPALLWTEVGRLLKRRGYFVFSFDFWPEKIDSDDVQFFGLDWIIFSRAEVAEMVTSAAALGLYPVGAGKLEVGERPVSFAGKSYTFAWMALQKKTSELK